MLRVIAFATVALAASSGFASAQDAAAGAKTFGTCRTCHQIGPGAKIQVGPPLTGVVGRPAGSYAGFVYSTAMQKKAAEIGVWDEAKIVEWLADPSKYLGGASKMVYKVAGEADRKNVAAYLATQK